MKYLLSFIYFIIFQGICYANPLVQVYEIDKPLTTQDDFLFKGNPFQGLDSFLITNPTDTFNIHHKTNIRQQLPFQSYRGQVIPLGSVLFSEKYQ